MTRLGRAPYTDVSAEESTAFVLVAHGPPVSSSEIESKDVDALEVRVFWDAAPLSTHHLGEGSLIIGDHEESIARIPESALGAPAFELARSTAVGFLVRVPEGAHARIGSGPRASYIEGPREFETSRGDAIAMTLGCFSIELSHVAAGKAVEPRGIAERIRDGATLEVLGAALLHTALFGAFAFYVPALVGEDDASTGTSGQIQLMRTYLDASAERERDRVAAPATELGRSGEGASSGGARAEGAEGTMGKSGARATDRRWAKLGPKDNPNPSLGPIGGSLPKGFELIALISDNQGDPDAPSAPWGALDALGKDPMSALGNMWGRTIGEAAGAGGLGLFGTGEGGDGRGQGIGLDMNRFGGLGHLMGGPGDDGFGGGGSCPGCRLRGHAVKGPSIRAAGNTIITGHIPAEVIQRVVRDNFGRFRSCYESGLRQNPSLEGRVVTRFAIDRQGIVTMAQDGGSSLPSSNVVSCVIRSFYSLSFPEHEGGLVTVVYPLALRPE